MSLKIDISKLSDDELLHRIIHANLQEKDFNDALTLEWNRRVSLRKQNSEDSKDKGHKYLSRVQLNELHNAICKNTGDGKE